MKALAVTNKEYLRVAIPFVLSTVTQPLLGAADTAVVGHLSEPGFIAGVSVGTVIFNTLYWLFGFLRVSTTGFSAQAADNQKQAAMVFIRPFTIALGLAAFFLVLQKPLLELFLWMLSPGEEVAGFVSTYFYILIWGSPFVLGNYVILGWMMGQGMIAKSLIMQITGNLLNILLDVIFVFYFHLDVGGVAAATLISQVVTFFIGSGFIVQSRSLRKLEWQQVFAAAELKEIFRTNSDLLLRTVCLLIQVNTFTWRGGTFGTVVLAANAVLYQLQSIISYMFDGLANASSIFAGRAWSQRNGQLFDGVLKQTWRWTRVFTLLTTIVLFVGRQPGIRLLTDIPAVASLALEYSGWLVLYPVIAGVGLTFYGVFTGTALTRPIRNSTFYALLLYLVIWSSAPILFHNHGLWVAFLAYYLGRSVFLWPEIKKISNFGGQRSVSLHR